jgi:hypothetical protein
MLLLVVEEQGYHKVQGLIKGLCSPQESGNLRIVSCIATLRWTKPCDSQEGVERASQKAAVQDQNKLNITS